MDDKNHLIQKLFANQCSKDELNLLFEMIKADESETAPEVMMTLLQQMNDVPTLESETSERIYKQVLIKSTEMGSHDKFQNNRLESKKRIFWMGKAAAAI